MTQAVKSENDLSLEDSIPDSGVSLEAILCTDELHRRPSRPPDLEKENRAPVKLVSADSPSTILQTLAETILDITQCDSAGLSLLTDEQRESHKTMSGVVTKAAGGLAIKTPQGTTYQLNENRAKAHGHEPFKEGDQVTFILDENNTLIDVHLKGQEGEHQYVTGKLIHLGKIQKEIKVATPEGEKVFPLANLEAKTKGIKEGTAVTLEVNDAGTVIDVHPATGGAVKP